MYDYPGSTWLKLLVSPVGSITPGVPSRTLGIMGFSLGVWSLHQWVYPFGVPVGLHEVGGAIVALALAFRTNSTYSRFWEARTLWGGIVNASRNLHRLIRHHASPEAAREAAPWIALFAHGTRVGLRGESIAADAHRLLARPAAEALTAARHPALHVADELSTRIAELRRRGLLDPLMARLAEGEVMALVDRLGGCERILKTPTPIGYVVMLRQLTVIFLLSLPFPLVGSLGLLTPLMVGAIAFPVLMIEGLGSELDDPFGHDPNDLPLTRICETIELDVVRDHELVQRLPGRVD